MLKLRNFLLVAAAIQICAGLQTNPKSCQSDMYFDTTNYKCQDCGDFAVQNTTSGQACVCKPGYQKVPETRFNFKFDC